MMRKWFSIFLIIILSLIPAVSFAAPVPLEAQGKKSVYVADESQVELVTFNIFFRVRTGFSSVNTYTVLKNLNQDEPVTFTMGIPVQLDNISKIRDLTVVADGKTVKVYQRSTAKNPPVDKEIHIGNWYVWDVALEPGESKVVESSFSFDNKLELDGTETITFPLTLLEHWPNNIKNIQIIADTDFYGPYAFDPAPSIAPVDYHDGGRLVFSLDNISSKLSDFELSFKPMDVVITRYIESIFESDNEIKNIVQNYRNGSYHQTVSLIHEYLSKTEGNAVIPELKYLEALCYQYLYDMEKALNLFNQLEPNPGFGESLSSAIKNKIIYDKTAILKNQTDGDERALEYLNSIKDAISDDSIFNMWLENEIFLLTPPVVIEEPVEEDTELEEEDTQEKETEDETQVIGKITIGEREFYIEEIIIAGLAIIILLIIIISIIRRRRRRRRSSIFRYY